MDGWVAAEEFDAAGGGAGKAEHQLDLGGFTGTVVADECDQLAGVEREVEFTDGDDGAVAFCHAAEGDGCLGHGITCGGAISGALSRTPPGSVAGKRDCAQRITWTAGLVISKRACGAVHITRSMMSFGR